MDLALKISNGLTKGYHSLSSKHKYVIAEGGITSSKIGVNVLEVIKVLM